MISLPPSFVCDHGLPTHLSVTRHSFNEYVCINHWLIKRVYESFCSIYTDKKFDSIMMKILPNEEKMNKANWVFFIN